jgi:hypothetical protein
MTPGNAAAARVRLIVWCKAWGHQVEPDLDEQGSDTAPGPPSRSDASGSSALRAVAGTSTWS